MKTKILKYLRSIDAWLYLILFFCLAGFLRNILQLFRFGLDYSNIAIRVFVAMSVIYFAQILFIFMKERKAWIISAVQALFCVYVYEDFTFLPLANAVEMLTSALWPNMDYGWFYFREMALISALFSLEIIKTYLLFVLTDTPKKTKKPNNKKTISRKDEVVVEI
ncbi:MAG: hypothetical protein LBM71_00990 [Elusimicrobiota bacterium]|jgi:hypothetical protein|nr:hypothetical protein [Elusimicrobiota bacterium]